MNEDILKGDVRQRVGSAERAMGDASGDLQLEMKGRVHEIAGKMQTAYGQAKDHAAETLSGVDAFVTERPYLCAGIAAIGGLALGFLMGLGRPKVIVVRPPRG